MKIVEDDIVVVLFDINTTDESAVVVDLVVKGVVLLVAVRRAVVRRVVEIECVVILLDVGITDVLVKVDVMMLGIKIFGENEMVVRFESGLRLAKLVVLILAVEGVLVGRLVKIEIVVDGDSVVSFDDDTSEVLLIVVDFVWCGDVVRHIVLRRIENFEVVVVDLTV